MPDEKIGPLDAELTYEEFRKWLDEELAKIKNDEFDQDNK